MLPVLKVQIIHTQWYNIIYFFSLKQLALSVRHILHPRLAVVINPSQHYKRID